MAEQVDLDSLERLIQEKKNGYPNTMDGYDRFMAHQRTVSRAAPALVAEVRQLRERNQQLRDSLKEMLNQYSDGGHEAGWVKRLHDEARAALAGEANGGAV